MIDTMMIGDVRITRIHEYSGPTHPPEFLLPDLDPAALERNRDWMAPQHWVPHMNRFVLTVQLWVVHAGGNIIVVDTGVGNGKPREGMARMHRLNTLVPEWLEAAGAPLDKVTHVAITHLHMDHVGWNTRWLDNRWTPTFPNARYYLPEDDFLYCKAGRNKVEGVDVFGDAFDDSVMPVVDAGLAVMMRPGMEIADCLKVEAAPGHSPGQVAFRIRSRGEEAVFSGDICHNPIQIACPEVNSGYCLWPDQARSTRHAFLEAAAEREALILPVHFGDPYCGYVRREGNGFAFEPLR
ncbi:MBL fold metallo-hydrolase [Paraburkholderia unamae]|uniref:Glyoxylase-like metal-dependent hydrolase (Beta-lactamase superfamily II) n=1 Tax=Paraburkholderia unamae TaxID=219649 RepID=A0ABX5KVS3_9BURK|nr:MBL fold metallo-hydrolase [Paraburkholderia unamae]PVX86327.1 glyoxylase-like metal-dependent hydrolase (beta-lactamase superfamily II) [Paraburkholderia unamae]RAR68128.1 glyoxylase-like metal-dependent hydrolase (beta-lactamase superfamily II) [Paraburkholderia unamae]CAG9263993.1 Beta-lactamase-like [Paraburkholderia unamae]